MLLFTLFTHRPPFIHSHHGFWDWFLLSFFSCLSSVCVAYDFERVCVRVLLIPFILSHQNDARHLLSLSLIKRTYVCVCVFLHMYVCIRVLVWFILMNHTHTQKLSDFSFLRFPVNYFWFIRYLLLRSSSLYRCRCRCYSSFLILMSALLFLFMTILCWYGNACDMRINNTKQISVCCCSFSGPKPHWNNEMVGIYFYHLWEIMDNGRNIGRLMLMFLHKDSLEAMLRTCHGLPKKN